MPPSPSPTQDAQQQFAQISMSILQDLVNAASAFDLPQLLNLIMDTVIRLADAQRGFLMLQHGDRLEFAVARNYTGGTVAGAPAEVSYTIISDVARSRTPVLTTDAQLDTRFSQAESIRGIGVKSVVACPLISLSGALVGVVYLDDCRRGAVFTDLDLDMLAVFASQAATAIENTRLQQALGQQRQQLETLNELRLEFIEAVSHELRTPLAAVKASLDLLSSLAAADQTTRANLLNTAREGLGRFVRVLNRLLEFSSGEMDAVLLPDRPTAIPLRSLVSLCLDGQAEVAAAKRLLLTNKVPADLSCLAVERRLQRALAAILDNAVQYTREQGAVEVSASPLQVATAEELPAVLLHRGRNFVVIRVRDTGPGIPPEELPLVFDRFFRGKRHSEEGLGLGLTVARRDIEAQGGAVLLQSDVDTGTVVSIYLPAAPTPVD